MQREGGVGKRRRGAGLRRCKGVIVYVKIRVLCACLVYCMYIIFVLNCEITLTH